MIATGNSSSPRHRRGFTLVELIVVLGLIMMLMGLLMPAVSRAWRQAQAVTCRAQLRDLGFALAVYANDNQGAVMPPGTVPSEWPEVLFGEPYPASLVCPTGAGEDALSYQLNWWLKFGSNSVRMDGSNGLGLPPSQILVAGETWPGRVEHYCWIQADRETSWDPARHGPGLLSNYLWLDLHVDNTVPSPLPPFDNPWRVLRQR